MSPKIGKNEFLVFEPNGILNEGQGKNKQAYLYKVCPKFAE